MFQQKKNYVLLALLFVPFIGFSQFSIYGKVKSKTTEKAIQYATVNIQGLTDTITHSANTEPDGTYHFSELSPGKYLVKVSKPNFKNFADTINIANNQIFIIELNDTIEHNNTNLSDFAFKTKGIMLGDTIVLLDNVVVSSTRSDRRSAMAYSNLNKEQIKEQNLGQDLPYLLNQQPSIV